MRIAIQRDALGYYAKPLWFALFMVFSAIAAGGISRFYSEPMNRWLRGTLARAGSSQTVSVAAQI
jgi:hypothetical protein